MPLTPRFSLRQTQKHVFVKISVPSFRLTTRSAGGDADDDYGCPSNGGMEVALTGENNSEFHFYAKPYLLKLDFFPRGFLDEDEGGGPRTNDNDGDGDDNDNDTRATKEEPTTARYDPSEQTIVVPLRKKPPSTKGIDDGDDDQNHWPDLELTARLLEAREVPKQWLHSVVDSTVTPTDTTAADEDLEDDAEDVNDNTGDDNNAIASCYDGYGFHNMFRNVLAEYCRSGLAEEMLPQLMMGKESIDPERSTIQQRRIARIEHELSCFDFERYLGDLELGNENNDDYLYTMVKDYVPWWRTKIDAPNRVGSAMTLKATSTTTTTESSSPSSLIQEMDNMAIHDADNKRQSSPTTTTDTKSSSIFTESEKLLLSTIPYPLLAKHLAHYRLWCGALELVLAYVYDHLTTMGDPSVESPWTVSVLSCQLSWLDDHSAAGDDGGSSSGIAGTVRSTVATFLRRVLVFPYWRNADDVGFRVVRETHTLLTTHRTRGCVKALLGIRTALDQSEVHYLGNKLFVDPYLYWVQNAGKDDGLDAILSELGELVDEDGFAKLLTGVEESLGIDAMMIEYFGEESDDDGSEDAYTSCGSSEEDDGSENESDSDDNGDDTEHQRYHSAEQISVASVRQLLDDQVGDEVSASPAASFSSLLVTAPTDDGNQEQQARQQQDNTRNRPLIQEL